MAELRAILIPADDTKPVQVVTVDSSKLAAAIGADWFELVSHDWLGQRSLTLVVDEEGLLNGAAPNRRATVFYPYGLGIRGDALVCGEQITDDGPDLACVAQFQVGAIVDVLTAGVL